MVKRTGLAILAWIALSLSAQASAPPVITIGILPVIDTLPLIAAKERGLFDREGVDVRLISFPSALERDTALRAGKISGYFGDLLNTLLLINGGERLLVVATAFRTAPDYRMFGLLASPKSGISSPKQAEGESVAISRASVIEYVLDGILAREGIGEEKVKKTEIRAIPIRYQMLMGDKVKLAILPEPLVTKAVSEGAILLADDRPMNTTLTVLALRGDLLQQHRGLATRFLKAYSEAVEMINRSPDSFKELLVRKTQVPPSVKDTLKVPRFPSPRVPPAEDVKAVGEWLVKRGMMAKPVPYESAVAR